MAQKFLYRTAVTAAFYSFALLNYFFYLSLSILSGAFFKKDTEQDKLQLAIERDRYWNLSKSPLPGFHHHFHRLRNGLKLHYICNKPLQQNALNLVIFIHGTPDSSMMWRYLLQEPDIPMRDATLVCVDLPGYGGSDSLPKYDTEILEALTEFVVAMRDIFLEADGNGLSDASTLIVAHDWGCVLSLRLAAEAPSLADRFILTNGPHVELAFANRDRILNSASKIFRQFRQSPKKNFGCLGKALRALRPLLVQILMFGYIFAFHLPAVMVQYLGTGGNFAFLRGALKAAHGENKNEFNPSESMASTLGPGIEECGISTSAQQNGAVEEFYSDSVLRRAKSPGDAFWNMTGYYRDDVAWMPWNKTLETIADLYALENEANGSKSPIRRRSSSSASSVLYTEQYRGALHAPATILWGEKDQACSKAICLDGIGDYLARDSEVTLLPRTGHWTAIEAESRAALAKVIGLYAGKQQTPVLSVTKAVNQVYQGAVMMVRK